MAFLSLPNLASTPAHGPGDPFQLSLGLLFLDPETLQGCPFPLLSLALSPGWMPWTHAVLSSPALSTAAPDWALGAAPGPGSSLASSGAVSGSHYQHLALPAMSSPHGTAPFGEGMAHAGVTLGCPSLLEQPALTAPTPSSLAFCCAKITILYVQRTKDPYFFHCNVSAKVLFFCITI